MFTLIEFIDYVWSFYNEDSDLYPIKGLTRQDILEAYNVYQKDFNWFVSYADQVVSFFDNMILVDANHLEVA